MLMALFFLEKLFPFFAEDRACESRTGKESHQHYSSDREEVLAATLCHALLRKTMPEYFLRSLHANFIDYLPVR
jgi:hypothetical protein